MQWRLTLAQGSRLHRRLPPPPAIRALTTPAWMRECLPARAERDNFFRAFAWNMLVVGSPGGGMFIHPDSYDSGTWQAQLLGGKEWALCDPARLRAGESLGEAGSFDAFTTERLPSACGIVTAHAGDLLVYPSRWWHQTRVPSGSGLSIGLAGRWVNAANWLDVAQSFESTCNSGAPDLSLEFEGATPSPSDAVCAGVRERCAPLWETAFALAEVKISPRQGWSHADVEYKQAVSGSARIDLYGFA